MPPKRSLVVPVSGLRTSSQAAVQKPLRLPLESPTLFPPTTNARHARRLRTLNPWVPTTLVLLSDQRLAARTQRPRFVLLPAPCHGRRSLAHTRSPRDLANPNPNTNHHPSHHSNPNPNTNPSAAACVQLSSGARGHTGEPRRWRMCQRPRLSRPRCSLSKHCPPGRISQGSGLGRALRTLIRPRRPLCSSHSQLLALRSYARRATRPVDSPISTTTRQRNLPGASAPSS